MDFMTVSLQTNCPISLDIRLSSMLKSHMRDIGTVDIGSPRGHRPEGFLWQQCPYSMWLERSHATTILLDCNHGALHTSLVLWLRFFLQLNG